MSNGVVEGSETGTDTAVKETPSSTGEESAVSEKVEQAGGTETGSSDGGSVDGQAGRQRGKSVYSQIRELQNRLREQRGYWESEVGGLKSQLEEIRAQFGNGQQGRKPGKTFWEAPEEVLEERLSTHLSDFEKRMSTKFEQTQAQREQAEVRKQEVSEAAKFIRSQKGMTEDDIQDIREILHSNPNLESLSPMDQAEFALFKWQKERGIGDNTAKKQRASTVTGAPPGGSGSPKVWSEAEIQAELSKFPPNPANYTPEDEARWKRLDDEWRRAYREKRVTK
jgi:hypothetical protein